MADPINKKCSGWDWPLYIQIFITLCQLASVSCAKIYDPRAREYVPMPTTRKMSLVAGLLLWNAIVGTIIYWLSANCHQGWAWFVVLLPLIINFIALAILFSMITIIVQN